MTLGLFAAGLGLCWSYGPARMGFFSDNQTFFYIAERFASGVPPHVSVVNHKLALCMMLSGLAIKLGRLLAIDDVLAVRALSMALSASTIVLVWGLARRLSGSALAAILAAVVMLTFSDFFKQGCMGVRPKVFVAFFMTLALVACADGKALRSGIYAAAAFLCWQPAAGVLVGVGAGWLCDRDRRQKALRAALGVLLALVVYEAYFVLRGVAGEQLYQNFVMAFDTLGHETHTLAETFGFILDVDDAGATLRTLWASVFLVWLVWTARAVAYCVVVPPRRVADHGSLECEAAAAARATVATVTTATVALGFTLVDFQGFPDRFYLLPFYAVASGCALDGLLGRVNALPETSRKAVLAAIAAAAILLSGLDLRPPQVRSIALEKQRKLASIVDRLEKRYGPVWVVSCVHLLGLLHRDNYDRFGVVIDARVRNYMRRVAGERRSYRPDELGRAMPALVLTSRHGTRTALPWIAAEYRRLEAPEFEAQGIRVWLRR